MAHRKGARMQSWFGPSQWGTLQHMLWWPSPHRWGADMRAVPSRGLGMAHTGHMPGLPGDSASHPSEEEKVRSTAHKRDGLLLFKEVTWHLRGDGGGVWDSNKGQVTKKEIHGGVEVWLHPDQDNVAQVPSQSHEVDPQKQYNQDNLLLWMFWKSQKGWNRASCWYSFPQPCIFSLLPSNPQGEIPGAMKTQHHSFCSVAGKRNHIKPDN